MGILNEVATIVAPIVNLLNHPQKPAVISLRDPQHANKTFSPNHSALAPKTKNWYHVYFDIDSAAAASVAKSLTGTSNANNLAWINDKTKRDATLGMLVKSISLPNFKFDVKAANQYNRWSLNLTKINYQPVTIGFWDDTMDAIRSVWYAYYQYLIQDPSYAPIGGFSQSSSMNPAWDPSYGHTSSLYTANPTYYTYGLDTANPNPTIHTSNFMHHSPFFRSIRIYQFNRASYTTSTSPADAAISTATAAITGGASNSTQVNYTEYVLVNPIISSFDHDTQDSASSEFMTHKMTVDYETVLYASGSITNPDQNNSWQSIASWEATRQLYLDTTPSFLTAPSSQPSATSNAASNTAAAGITNLAPSSANPTVLSTPQGSASSVTGAADSSGNNPIINVPTTNSGYGPSGYPPIPPPVAPRD